MQDTKTIMILVAGIAVWLFIGYLFAKIFFLTKLKKQRKSAVSRSRSVVLWQVSEQIAPLLPKFPYSYKDLMFLGKWVDYMVFDGLSEWHMDEVVFLEIKTGRSGLNKNERLIKSCIDAWRVRYELLRL